MLILVCFGLSSLGQLEYTRFNDLNDSLAKNPKPVLVKIEADWCGYCKMMEDKVFQHKKLSGQLQQDYYVLKLDAEKDVDIKFGGRDYHFIPSSSKRGVHELAKFLGTENGKLNFPTIVELKSDLTFSKRLTGYLGKADFKQWLQLEGE